MITSLVFRPCFPSDELCKTYCSQVVAKRQSALTKEEAGEKFQCDKCDKFYAKKYSLLAHVKKVGILVLSIIKNVSSSTSHKKSVTTCHKKKSVTT